MSRFRSRAVEPLDPSVEDYWFLVVNRRALASEIRKIRLVVQVDTAYMNYPYFVDYILGDSTKVAAPCQMRIPTCAYRYIDVVLLPGEGQLLHFYRGYWGCDTTLAHIDSLTITLVGPNAVRLDWELITETDIGEPFDVDTYFISGSPRARGPFAPIGVVTSNSFVDSVFYSAYDRYFYQVQACGPAAR